MTDTGRKTTRQLKPKLGTLHRETLLKDFRLSIHRQKLELRKHIHHPWRVYCVCRQGHRTTERAEKKLVAKKEVIRKAERD